MPERRSTVSIAALAALAILAACAPDRTETGDRRTPRGPAGRLDLVISNGRLVDGSGAAAFTADIGIVGDRIVAIGDLSERSAERTIDAGGLVVCPGFIDLHTHVDDAFDDPDASAALNYLIQGVTTLRPGADGTSDERILETKARWERNGMGMNAVITVGFNVVRREVMGDDFLRPATLDEIERMRARVRQGMDEGAFGISVGLEYEGLNVHASTEELIEVTKAVAPYGGFYVAHMRDEASRLVEAVRETIRIGEEAGVPVSVTHFKACGRDNWGLMREAVSAIEEARARGIRITADQYPFDQSAPIGFITELVDVPRDMEPFAETRRARRGASPEERARLRDEYVQSLQAALRDESTRARLRESTYEPRVADPSPAARWGWQDFRIKVAVTNAHLLDRNLGELVEERGRDGFDIVADLVLSEPDMLFASGSQSGDDLRLAMTRPWVMVSSDGGAFAPVPHDAPPVRAHPRSFASQAVLLRKFVREEGLLSLEEAIRKMTSLPASLLGLERRGMLREGYAADVVVFDPETISDRATYADARKYAVGVRYVIVNGELSVAEGTFNGHVSGKVLLKKEES